jgi:hypothetical protein
LTSVAYDFNKVLCAAPRYTGRLRADMSTISEYIHSVCNIAVGVSANKRTKGIFDLLTDSVRDCNLTC